MKNILLISPSPNLAGGISKWTKHILCFFEKENECAVELLPIKNGYINHTNKNSWGTRIRRGFFLYFDILIQLKNKLELKKYSSIHLSTSASISLIKDYFILKIANKNKIPSILHFHFGRIPELYNKNNWEWKLLLHLIKLSTKTVVIDKFSLDVLINLNIKNVYFIPNPIGNEVLKIINKNKNHIIASPKDIVFVGQLIHNKGIFELVEACKDIPNIKLKMFGSSNDVVEKKLKEKAGINNNWLEIYGETDYETVIKNMMSAGVFVLPTYTEGFPNVILESMACSCPIVTTNVGAIPEMLNTQSDTEQCGIVIKPRNVEQLKNAILTMINDRKFALLCGENAKNRVLKLYSIDSVANQWKELWN